MRFNVHPGTLNSRATAADELHVWATVKLVLTVCWAAANAAHATRHTTPTACFASAPAVVLAPAFPPAALFALAGSALRPPAPGTLLAMPYPPHILPGDFGCNPVKKGQPWEIEVAAN
eukprot:jgi/Ulvmu1/5022/UM021_0039.1